MPRFSIRTPGPLPPKRGVFDDIMGGLVATADVMEQGRAERNKVGEMGGEKIQGGHGSRLADWIRRQRRGGALREAQRQGQDIVGPMPEMVDIGGGLQTDDRLMTPEGFAPRPAAPRAMDFRSGRDEASGPQPMPARPGDARPPFPLTGGFNPSAPHPLAGRGGGMGGGAGMGGGDSYTYEAADGSRYRVPRNQGLSQRIATRRAELELEDEFDQRERQRKTEAFRGRYGDDAEFYAEYPQAIGYEERATRERERDQTRREIADMNNQARREIAQIRAALSSGTANRAELAARIRLLQSRAANARSRLGQARDMQPNSPLDARMGERSPYMSERYDQGAQLEADALGELESIDRELMSLQSQLESGGRARPSFGGVQSGGRSTAPRSTAPDSTKAQTDPAYREWLRKQGARP